MTARILIVDDDDGVLAALSLLFKVEGYDSVTAHSPSEVIKELSRAHYDLLLADMNYTRHTTSGTEGIDLIAKVRELNQEMPIVVMTSWGSVEIAVQALHTGAADFIEKPWDNKRLISVISNQLKLSDVRHKSLRLKAENDLLRDELDTNSSLISISPVMQKLMSSLARVAISDANILLTGENGTGKSLIAHHIHQLSNRCTESLISVNMGAISESLFESEMFGHVKGSFTDAREDRIGRFELADSGTLFLDEVANTPLTQQAKLLRVLEDRRFEKLGSSRTIDVDVRLICATNADLTALAETNHFRTDLLYRINTLTFEIPPLRQRVPDIMPLAESFLARYAQKYGRPVPIITPEAARALMRHHWPGNVRELDHTIERAFLLHHGDHITDLDLGIAQDHSTTTLNLSQSKDATLDDIEREIIKDRLELWQGNANAAAESLGLTKSAFYRRLKKFSL